MNTLLKNWKTSATGVAGVLTGLGALITILTSGAPIDPAVLGAALVGIVNGIGNILSKDANVTGT